MRRFFPSFALILIAGAAAAQEGAVGAPDPKVPQGKNLEVPVGWTVRTDHADTKVVIGKEKPADIVFVNMTPGWHITTGPAAILYHPASVAKGTFRVDAKIHFFAPEPGHLEGYGIFFGGTDLDKPEQAYGYFLLRNDGAFLIKKRKGEATEVVRDWTKNDSVAVFKGGAEPSIANTLAVEARTNDVAFSVNGREVAVVQRSALPVDGVVGLRINHHVNVHVSDLSVKPLPAAAR